MEAQTASRYGALTKDAIWPFTRPEAPDPQLVANAQNQSAEYMVRLILAALGAGVVGRSALGAYQMFNQPKIPQLSGGRRNITLDVASKAPDEDEEKLARVEGIPQPEAANLLEGARNWVDRTLMSVKPEQVTGNPGILGFLQGAKHESPWSNPMTYGVGVPLALLALYGGYKGTDKLLDSRRQAELDDELEEAKQKYQQLIADQGKTASVDESLDEMAATSDRLMEKLAQEPLQAPEPSGAASYVPKPVWNLGGAATALPLGWALLAALLTGKLSYDYVRSRSPDVITEKAVKERERKRSAPASYLTTS